MAPTSAVGRSWAATWAPLKPCGARRRTSCQHPVSLGGKPAARMGRAVQHQESAAAVVSNVGRPGGASHPPQGCGTEQGGGGCYWGWTCRYCGAPRPSCLMLFKTAQGWSSEGCLVLISSSLPEQRAACLTHLATKKCCLHRRKNQQDLLSHGLHQRSTQHHDSD